MKKILNLKNIYLIYTMLFILISAIIFSVFAINKCSFIWQADGLKQHFIILKDFNENIRNFLSNPSDGLDLFSWSMGLGLDVIGQYSYYVLGDPFAYISLLFPLESLEYAYTFLIILRMFCIGLSFIAYGKYHSKCISFKEEKSNKERKAISNYNILIGGLIYTFSGFGLFAGVRHPYFLNAMILFPLLLIGMDKLLYENKKVPLALFVSISAISNYYFFYMHTIMLIIYAFISYFCEFRKEGIKHFFSKFGSAIACYAIGTLIAGIILLPTIYAFLNSARSGEEVICKYGMDYYKSLFTINLLTAYGENWSFIGVSSLILLMMPVLWLRRKEHKTYFIYLIIATIILLVPFLGSMMNGFSFPNNRWSFIYGFILAFIITLCLDNKYTKKEIKYMCLFVLLYCIAASIAVLCIKSRSCFAIYLIQIIIGILMLLTVLYNNYEGMAFLKKIKINKFKTGILLLVICNITVMAYGLYTSYDRNYAKQFIKMETCEQNISTQLGANANYSKNIQNIIQSDNSFYRIAKAPHQMQNLSVFYNYPSTECFLSIGNKYVYNLNRELADNIYSTTSSIRGLGDRTKITTLLGTKYYVVDDNNKNNVPYGYTLKEKNNNVSTYENNFPLSIGITYSKYILREDYEKLNPIQKEAALMRYAVIDSEDEIKGYNLQRVTNFEDLENCYNIVDYKLIDEDKIMQNDRIVTNKKNQKLTFEISEVKNSELYVYISGFEYQGISKHGVTASYDGKNVAKSIENKLTSAYYQKAPEILLNLGYYEKKSGNIDLTFTTKGTYKFKDIQIIAVPMSDYEQTVKELQNNELQVESCTNKEIKGTVNLNEDRILQIATSYTNGWKAYVDGKKIDTIRVNTAFIGIPVERGQHEINLKYEVPYLNYGIGCSILGATSLIILVVLERIKKVNNK